MTVGKQINNVKTEYTVNLVHNNSKLKVKNVFDDGFEYLKMVHKKVNSVGEKIDLISNTNTNTNINTNPFKEKTRTIEFNKLNNVNKVTRTVTNEEQFDFINTNNKVNYNEFIENKIIEKVNKNIKSISDKVYNNIEKRLKSEYRRKGIF